MRENQRDLIPAEPHTGLWLWLYMCRKVYPSRKQRPRRYAYDQCKRVDLSLSLSLSVSVSLSVSLS
eukprot:COSAG01_NODE_33994_length_555_cov_0.969298_1_plen_65_part_10